MATIIVIVHSHNVLFLIRNIGNILVDHVIIYFTPKRLKLKTGRKLYYIFFRFP